MCRGSHATMEVQAENKPLKQAFGSGGLLEKHEEI